MDFRFDHGFITGAEKYIQKRIMLQQKLEDLTTIPSDNLTRAADLLDNFGVYLEARRDDIGQQNELLKTIINRVFVKAYRVKAIELKAEMYVVTGKQKTELLFLRRIVPLVGAEGLGHARVPHRSHPKIPTLQQAQQSLKKEVNPNRLAFRSVRVGIP